MSVESRNYFTMLLGTFKDLIAGCVSLLRSVLCIIRMRLTKEGQTAMNIETDNTKKD